jgi:hypothetical protein
MRRRWFTPASSSQRRSYPYTQCEPQQLCPRGRANRSRCQRGTAKRLDAALRPCAPGRGPHAEHARASVSRSSVSAPPGRGTMEVDDLPADRSAHDLRLWRYRRPLPVHACCESPGLVRRRSTRCWVISSAFASTTRSFPGRPSRSPEVARVGLSEDEARAQGVPYEVTRYGIDDLDRAIADSEDDGFVKVLTEPGRDRILGATIVSTHAGDLLTEFILAMKHGLGLEQNSRHDPHLSDDERG